MRSFAFTIIGSILMMNLGCQTGGSVIREAPAGAAEIRRVLGIMFGPVRSTARGGTEFIYGYHDKEMKLIEAPDDAKERFIPVVTVIGDRRPYDVRIQVYVERRNRTFYERIGQNDFLAKEWAVKLRDMLHEGREKRNVIDDFKAF